MTRKRLRFIAIQAIVVSVLGVVVVLTLLQPESNISLSGVSGPGATTSIADGATDQNLGDHDGGSNHDGNGGNAGGGAGGQPPASPPAATPSAPAPAPAVPAPVPGTTPGTGESEGDSPSADQYADTLARLSSELN